MSWHDSAVRAAAASSAAAAADLLAAALGWSAHDRLLHLETAPGQPALLAERMALVEAVCEGFELRLDALAAPDADVTHLLGTPATLRLLQADGLARGWQGWVVETTRLGPVAGLLRWQLLLRPWTALLQRRWNCVLHEDASVRDILERLFATLPQANWRFDLAHELPRRTLCTQYAESDWDFCTRLMAEEGLAWHIEQLDAADADAAQAQGLASHRLVIADEHAARRDLGAVRFAAEHPSALQPGQRDAVSAFAEHRVLQPGAVTVGAWSPCRVAGVGAARGGTGSGPRLEHYDVRGPEREADPATAAAVAERRLRAFELGRQVCAGAGSARHLAAGAVFELHEAPGGDGGPRRLLLLRVEHEAANNLGPVVAHRLAASGVEAGRYRNRFDAVPAAAPLVPPLRPRPAAPGLQTATVVGFEHGLPAADGDLRVKVRYAWQDTADPGEDGFAETPWPLPAAGAGRGGAWLRVAQAAAGAGWGAVFVPRVGSEVLVGYLDGDIDRPVVVGALFNGRDPPPYAAGPGSAANHAGVLGGIVSTSAVPGGAISGEWVFDDSTGALRTRLCCLPTPAELSLGQLVTQRSGDSRRGAARGCGFEAATAGWASLRAGRGLLLTTHRRAARYGSCDGGQMDADEARSRLQRLHDRAAAIPRAATAPARAASEVLARAAAALLPAGTATGALASAGTSGGERPLPSSTAAGVQPSPACASTVAVPLPVSAFAVAAPLPAGAVIGGQTLPTGTSAGPQERPAGTSVDVPQLSPGATADLQPPAATDAPGSHPLPADPQPLPAEACYARLADARLVFGSEAGLVLASDADLLLSAGAALVSVADGELHETAVQQAALAAGGALQLSSGDGGLSLVAAAGDVSLHAHAGPLTLRCDGALRIQAHGDELRLVARQRLALCAGGSAIVLDGADIRLTTPGVLEVAAAAHRFPGPARVAAHLPALPDQLPGRPPNWIEIEHHDADGRPFAGQRYTIHFAGGTTIQGRLDGEGQARHEAVPEKAERVVYEPRDPGPVPPWPPLQELVDAVRERLG
ncbi:hypothetical protein CKO44_20040 [Rubrivivax gelatinosus]|uniref:type VI secretion system tip protein TssI/VgrG n=1 Tax=Rubrivivax gelatinosus TaxID=28068 RepID=UPI001908DDCB|nr:type VI secretion system tip protein TssI/VgrG [Rubrivivax gelatinosus]MBK1615753.1 hypothetical protein [Rubrivivax gelatinosus]